MKAKSKVAITGAGGLMGRALVDSLSQQGYELHVLCLPSEAVPDTWKAIRGLHLFRGNICQTETMLEFLDGVEIVYHLAGIILAPNPSMYQEVNVQGTQNVIDLCKEKRVSSIIYISSASVLYPKRTQYGESKYLAEQAVIHSGMAYTILRPTLAVDSSGGIEFNHFLTWIKKWPILFLPGGGRCLKRPVHSSDLAWAMSCLVENEVKVGVCVRGKIYNLSGGETLCFRDIILICAQKLGIKPRIINLPIRPIKYLAKILDVLIRKPALPSQALAGFLENADLSPEQAFQDFGYKPQKFSDFVEQIFPRNKNLSV